MKNYCLYFLLISFILSGCRSKQLAVTDFVSMTSPVAFEGTYLNKGDTLSSLFNIGGSWGLKMRDSIQFITFKFNGKDTLKLSYLTDAGLQEKSYKGKLKNNFFEIHLEKKHIIIPPVFYLDRIDRLRIGTDDSTNLLIHKWYNLVGFCIFASAVDGGNEYTKRFTKFDIEKSEELTPFQEDGKWGYADRKHNLLIPPQFESVKIFSDGVARVKKDGKWGIIKQDGTVFVPFIYDKISEWDKVLSARNVSRNGKEGYINSDGEEFIPVIYDEIIRYTRNYEGGIMETRLNGKYGFASPKGVICPPVFDEVSYFTPHPFMNQTTDFPVSVVTYKGQPYLLDMEGYVYKYTYKYNRFKLKGAEFSVDQESKLSSFQLEK
ncbi:WG repeat protein [Dysgonomonas alginatilytica]|uniref:WG repeat protein n=1 Tax=Dysgonomonas alginatilytica TaxID=1605892 RepID=A0A2V3PW93_9BACT|nr:WG repeat-containing protein [Dysgonomonas alginatilytica]PXV69064.1 WG repeat protein [Dysgonomonas alginatilytica]